MSISLASERLFVDSNFTIATDPASEQRARILTALDAWGKEPVSLDRSTLGRYYRWLTSRLALPIVAHYPKPANDREEPACRCQLVSLIDPTNSAFDEFTGIHCKVLKGGFEVVLPLVELEIDDSNPNCQLIADYAHWFWHWRV